jgi:hypothetical protein
VRITRVATVLLCLLALAVVACGDDDDDDDADASEEPTETATASADISAAGDNPVEVEAVDLEFEFDTDAITTDTTGLVFSNNGSTIHQLNLMTAPDDIDLEPFFTDLPRGFTDALALLSGAGLNRVGNVEASAGDQAALAFEEPLEPGRYVIACFIYLNERYHAQQGMWTEFTVE